MNAPLDPARLHPVTLTGPAPRHNALALTAGGALALIELNGQTYCLRITRAGKLILTK